MNTDINITVNQETIKLVTNLKESNYKKYFQIWKIKKRDLTLYICVLLIWMIPMIIFTDFVSVISEYWYFVPFGILGATVAMATQQEVVQCMAIFVHDDARIARIGHPSFAKGNVDCAGSRNDKVGIIGTRQALRINVDWPCDSVVIRGDAV